MNPVARFESYVYPEANTGCWLWGGAVSKSGYGAFGVNLGPRENKQISAHRFAYEAYKGAIPDGHVVMHKCDTPACVNPDHLRVGTYKDNTRDMMAKGRRVAPSTKNRARGEKHHSRTKPEVIPCGEAHSQAKLTSQKVQEIRASDEPGVLLAKRYGVSNITISRIRRRIIWKSVA